MPPKLDFGIHAKASYRNITANIATNTSLIKHSYILSIRSRSSSTPCNATIKDILHKKLKHSPEKNTGIRHHCPRSHKNIVTDQPQPP